MIQQIWLIPLFPLLGFIITGMNFRRLPVRFSGWIASGMVFISFLLSLAALLQLAGSEATATISVGDWIKTPGLNIPLEFLFDQLSCLMMLIVTGVGTLIHIYSIGYMSGDENYNRFFSWMNLFIFFMLILVMGGNYAIMFTGWEGVGLCSYLLIGFWDKNDANNDAARKAFIMNRIGDLGFLLGMFLIYLQFGSLNYGTVFSRAAMMVPGTVSITIITLLLFAGATGKSAQIPLLTWLPDAMAGPTPVSALIHAATMVTAGIYMVARSGVLYALAPITMNVIAATGLATALISSIIALFQNDIKKILAYSTISQLGIMFTGLAAGSFGGSMFHLMTHAFFKALLFLAAGGIIHALSGEQDIRNMGGLRKKIPWTFLIFLTGALALSGIPPFSGFFSKDEILAAAFSKNPGLWIIAAAVSALTAAYTFRLVWITFTGEYRGAKANTSKIHESPCVMLLPLSILSFLSAFGAIPFIFHNGERTIFESFLSPVFRNAEDILKTASSYPSEQTNLLLIFTTLTVILVSILATYMIFVTYKRVPSTDDNAKNWFIKFARRKFYIDEFYDFMVVRPLYRLSDFLRDIIDAKFFDRIVESAGKFVMYTGSRIRLLQTGNVGFYLFAMVVCIILVLLLNLLK